MSKSPAARPLVKRPLRPNSLFKFCHAAPNCKHRDPSPKRARALNYSLVTAKISKYSLLFKDIDPFSWHGAKKNTFCVDFSVGARWRDRRKDQAPEGSAFHLAALRWPEKIIMTDPGFIQATR